MKTPANKADHKECRFCALIMQRKSQRHQRIENEICDNIDNRRPVTP